MIIGTRYNGPPGSGNGGYSAGLVATAVPWPDVTEVTLRKPPPLETELTPTVEGDVLLVTAPDGELIAEARPTTLGDPAVPPVTLAEAVAAAQTYGGFARHPFPTCFVCGPDRTDGLRLFPGRLGDGRAAAPFSVPDDISPELMWAALDCPGGWSVPLEARPYVLGRHAARVAAVPKPGEECVVVGQLTGEDGRKAFTLTTVYGPDGALLATARSTWIAL